MAERGLLEDEAGVARCRWAGADALYVAYHDNEWGRPVADDRRLFEKICLEGFQSGLSWLTILRKREHFRAAFADFDFERVAHFDERAIARLLADPGIVRHRGKITSTIQNARRALELREECGSLARFFWEFEPAPAERPRRLTHAALRELTRTPASIALAKALKGRGWTFVGPTTCYAFMQAMGMVNDHLEGCAFRTHSEAARSEFKRPV